MDSQQTNPNSQLEQEIARLKHQLSEVIAAERFFETDSGRLWTELATKEITRAVNDISSNMYEKDHNGYVKRLADLQAYKTILRKMQVAGSPARKQKLLEYIDTKKDGL